jgi:hypothetical protein
LFGAAVYSGEYMDTGLHKGLHDGIRRIQASSDTTGSYVRDTGFIRCYIYTVDKGFIRGYRILFGRTGKAGHIRRQFKESIT